MTTFLNNFTNIADITACTSCSYNITICNKEGLTCSYCVTTENSMRTVYCSHTVSLLFAVRRLYKPYIRVFCLLLYVFSFSEMNRGRAQSSNKANSHCEELYCCQPQFQINVPVIIEQIPSSLRNNYSINYTKLLFPVNPLYCILFPSTYIDVLVHSVQAQR